MEETTATRHLPGLAHSTSTADDEAIAATPQHCPTTSLKGHQRSISISVLHTDPKAAISCCRCAACSHPRHQACLGGARHGARDEVCPAVCRHAGRGLLGTVVFYDEKEFSSGRCLYIYAEQVNYVNCHRFQLPSY